MTSPLLAAYPEAHTFAGPRRTDGRRHHARSIGEALLEAAERWGRPEEDPMAKFRPRIIPKFRPHVLAAPGSMSSAPCDRACDHPSCVEARRTAAAICTGCSEPIGYDNPYLVVDGREVHEDCLIETHAAQRGAA